MDQVRPKHILLLVVAALVLTGSLVYQCHFANDDVDIADSTHLVDFQSGEIFKSSFPHNKAVSYPAKNPKSNAKALLPVYQRDGKWYLDGRMVGNLKELVPGGEKYLVNESGELTLPTAEVTRADVF